MADGKVMPNWNFKTHARMQHKMGSYVRPTYGVIRHLGCTDGYHCYYIEVFSIICLDKLD